MVALSIEVVLMRKGGPQYHLVLARLERDFDCKIYDCFEHPEYLKEVLQQVYGTEYRNIIENLQVELGSLFQKKRVTDFINALGQ
jgi:hypothetical protein